ncbi:cyclohexadienyl dehydrogenase [Lachnospiraceae bacterium]|nr:cyclohexadienyl dehydrogenase [Lachnospiraceae bacterium]
MNCMINSNKFGFLSLGLIGGSIALAIKQINKNIQIVAYARRQSTLDEALATGAIDIGTTEINELFSDCNMIFLCGPVSVNNQFLKQLKPFLSDKTIITDVGSVKGSIHQTVSQLGLDHQFIGGHPMAGSEKTGFANATSILLENAYYILTPTKTVSKEAVAAYHSLVKKMGAIPMILNSQEHDYVTAAISHVPHLVAAALANLVHDHDFAEGTMKMIAAGGFKDITRIASSSPDMWESICMSNTENIANLLDDYIHSLQSISTAVRTKKVGFTHDLFAASKEYRDSFSDLPRGPIDKVFACYVDIPDEAGAIASLATLLAKADISIKNIGIIHNRDFEEGVLRIEFYNQNSLKEAITLLKNLHYSIYQRK